MIWQIAGVVGVITGPLYALIISLMNSVSSMNREVGEIKKDVKWNRDQIRDEIKQRSSYVPPPEGDTGSHGDV